MSLESLVNKLLSNPWNIGMIPEDAPMHMVEDVTSVTWLREGPYQVQMFIVPPNYIIPEHTHPNVDSYEIMLGGRVVFSKNGRWVTEDGFEVVNTSKPPMSPRRGCVVRVRPNDKHGGVFGSKGGVFMSVQHWLNGVEPHCVAMDYDGQTLGDRHLSDVKNGDAKSKGGQHNLTFKDAASGEDDAPWEYLKG